MDDSRVLEMEEGQIIDEETGDEALASSIEKKLRKISHSPASCCIFEVPKMLKEHNRDAYEPFVVSIGPFHRGKEDFRFMEQLKYWYLHSLLSRISPYGVTMKSLVTEVRKLEKSAYGCYAGERMDGPEEDEFVEMLIVDGCFVVELFRKEMDVVEPDNDDPVFNMSCMHQYVEHDLFLLENQLPWFIVQCIFILTKDPEPDPQRNPSLPNLAIGFFHLPESMIPNPLPAPKSEILHVLDLIWLAITASFGKDIENKGQMVLIPCVRELVRQGVEFEKGEEKNLLNVEFKDGKLVIPPLVIDEMTEPLLRNLIAFEQLYRWRSSKVTSYAILMDRLIDTDNDVRHLRMKDIINLWLSEKDTAAMFDRLYYDTQIYEFYYTNVCEEVKKYIDKKRHAWKAMLKNEYFDNPWTSLSVIAASLLLVLTLFQSFCAVKEAWKF